MWWENNGIGFGNVMLKFVRSSSEVQTHQADEYKSWKLKEEVWPEDRDLGITRKLVEMKPWEWMVSPREKKLSEKWTLKGWDWFLLSQKERRDTKTNGRVWVIEAKAPGEKSTGQMLGTLGLCKAWDFGGPLIYFTQGADTEHCLGLLCFRIPF